VIAGDEDLESVSDTETSSVGDEDLGDKLAFNTVSTPLEDGANVAASGTSVVAVTIAEEALSTTSTTTDDEQEASNNNNKGFAPVNSAAAVAPVDRTNGAAAPKDTFLTSWYPFLKDLTAPTTFVSVSVAETQAVLLAADVKTAAQANKGDLATLEGKLDRAIEEQGGVVFIKIETRSPKDVLQSNSMMDRLRGLVKPTMRPATGHLSVHDRVEIANADTIAFVKGIRQLFKIKSGAEAIAMLKMSERVRSDLEKSLASGGSLICVRKWRDVDAAREFRAFVFNRKLTACSQYCYYQCFPELLKSKDLLSDRIVKFFEQRVLPSLPYKDAVIDFHVTDELIEIIELSPFAFSTGACMFSWKSETDKAILENGPFELRILTEPKLNPYECLPSKWRQWFESERGFTLRNNVPAQAPQHAPEASANVAVAAAPAAQQAPKLPALPLAGAAPAAKKEEKKKWTFGKSRGKKEKEKEEKKK
jgi:hypothetical protein